MDNLESSIKALIIETLNLEDMGVEEIETDAPLFVDGLGLDSIDALELGVAIKKKYNVSIKAEDSKVQSHFSSVKSLAEFIRSNVSDTGGGINGTSRTSF